MAVADCFSKSHRGKDNPLMISLSKRRDIFFTAQVIIYERNISGKPSANYYKYMYAYTVIYDLVAYI